MAPLMLTSANNKRTGFLTGLRRKVVNVKAICDVLEVLELDKLSAASERLTEAWQKYENSQMDVFSLVTEEELVDVQVTFIEMEEIYEAAIDEANKIIRDIGRALQPEETVQLAEQRRSLNGGSQPCQGRAGEGRGHAVTGSSEGTT